MSFQRSLRLAYAAICPLLAAAGAIAGGVASAAPFWDQGDGCMIPHGFFAVVMGIIGAVAGGAFGLVLGICVVVTCEGDRVLEGPEGPEPLSQSGTLLRPAGPARAIETLLRAEPSTSENGSHLLLREPFER